LAGSLPSDAADKVDPVADAKAFRKFFTDKFPKVKLEDFVNGPYSMNEDLYRQWQEKEQFPPYEFSLEMGKELFSKPFKNGKDYVYTRRGQLNFSCATCHVQSPGERIRAEILAPALGIVNAMPIYRSEWSGMGTTSRRFTTCNSQIRGVPFSPQDDEYRNVEYYLSYVSNGLPISGPGARP